MDSQDNKRKWKNRDLLSSLDFALTGIFTAIKEERNMRKHAVTSLLVLLAGIVFQVSRIEWLFLLLSIFLVIAFEILNSAYARMLPHIMFPAGLSQTGMSIKTEIFLFPDTLKLDFFHHESR